MDEAKFTRGLTAKGAAPTCDEIDGVGDYALIDPDGRIVGEAYRTVAVHDKRPARENALLWAAAPDNYNELEAAYEQAIAQFKVGDKYATFSRQTVKAWRYSLAKARGEL